MDDHDADYTRLDIFKRRLVLFGLNNHASIEILEVHDKQWLVSYDHAEQGFAAGQYILHG